MTDERESPWSEEAEQQLVGWMLSPGPARDKLRVLDNVDAESFWKPEHRDVFGVLAAMLGDGKLVDTTTVAAELERRKARRGDDRSWSQRLLELQATAGIHGSEYARIVAELATLRRGILHADKLRDLAYAGDLDALLGEVDKADEALRAPLPAVESMEGHELVALADLDARTPQKPWAMPGLLRVNEKLVVTGGEGVGKMTLGRQFAVTVASGYHPLLGIDVGDEPQPTLIVDLQEDRIDTSVAIAPMLRKAGDAYVPGMLHAVMWPAGVNLLARRDLSRLEALIDQHRPTLVIMGPLVRMYRADAGRSRYSEDLVDELTDNLDQLMVRYGFALVLEGHAGNDRDRGGEEAWRPRGSSVWRSWPSVGIGLEGIRSAPPREAKVHTWRWSRYADRAWPERLVGGGRWPWGLDDHDFARLCRGIGRDELVDGIATQEGMEF